MRILYFTDDFSQENIQFAQQNGLTMRKRSAYHQIDTVEQCSAVCGDVPQAYLDKYPVHELPKTEHQKALEQAELEKQARLKAEEQAKAEAKLKAEAEEKAKKSKAKSEPSDPKTDA
ncbi:hypothetical protein [Moraxella sp. ZY210820]|uniref:hypothetical protein n=1 Tax=Moraxella sp. ZY210820 TaxID=2904123 RepID=UPI0027311FAD|nr:hypothetical protein [Moraxella sp. ZY210820]WLF84833.1 hypothetical protein LU301_05050 [Moraxella sp. ZY210820]